MISNALLTREAASVTIQQNGCSSLAAGDVPPQTQPPDFIELRCACCGRPFAILREGKLIIQSRHGGQIHTNVIPIQMAITLTPP